MPRGKNYVNQNKGMALQAAGESSGSGGAGAAVSELCFYGATCQRKDCIYKHEGANMELKRSTEPCMAYLAGSCTFNAKTCRKRHPATEEEATQLRTRYQQIQCRFGTKCKTKGCLYIHSEAPPKGGGKNGVKQQSAKSSALEEPNAFPPLPGTATTTTATTKSTTEPPKKAAWGPSQTPPVLQPVVAVPTPPLQQLQEKTTPAQAAQQAATPPQAAQQPAFPPVNAWSQQPQFSGSYAAAMQPPPPQQQQQQQPQMMMQYHPYPPQQMQMNGNHQYYEQQYPQGDGDHHDHHHHHQAPMQSHNGASAESLNIHAKEFMPGGM